MASAIPFAVAAVAGAGMQVVAGLLQKTKDGKPLADNRLTTLAQRGAFVPYVIGRRRTAPLFAWAGRRIAKESTDGGKGGGASGTQGYEYKESGWHIITIGPAKKIHGIFQNGKRIDDPNVSIDPVNTPSGTLITMRNGEGSGYIYWGEPDQPINLVLAGRETAINNSSIVRTFPPTGPILVTTSKRHFYNVGDTVRITGASPSGYNGKWTVASVPNKTQYTFAMSPNPGSNSTVDGTSQRIGAGIGVESRHPRLCYFHWSPKVLGSTAQWSDIIYDVETEVQVSQLIGSPKHIDPSAVGRNDTGPNPAHVLWQLIVGRYPYGVGVPLSMIDRQAFEDLGARLYAEHLPCNVLITDGQTAQEKIVELMTDYSFVMPQFGRLLTPYAVRELDPDSLLTVNDDMLVPDEPEVVKLNEEEIKDRIVFIYSDVAHKFRDTEVSRDDDATALSRRRVNVQKVAMPSITDKRTALKTVDRRMLEVFVQGQTFKLRVTRGARRLRAGQSFIVPGIGQLRVMSVDLSTQTTLATVEAVLDQYGLDPESATPTDADDEGSFPESADPAPDVEVVVKQLNRAGATEKEIGVFRVRANSNVVGSRIWISVDDSHYYREGRQDEACSGGVLETAILAGAGDPIDVGPVIDPFNSDIDNALDLSGDTTAWNKGKQLCLIGDELFYLKRVEILGDGSYRLRGMQRAKEGTTAHTHNIGAKAFIIPKRKLKPITSELIDVGNTVYVKSVPFTPEDTTNISDVTAKTVTIA